MRRVKGKLSRVKILVRAWICAVLCNAPGLTAAAASALAPPDQTVAEAGETDTQAAAKSNVAEQAGSGAGRTEAADAGIYTPPPADRFFENPKHSFFRISPSGDYVAFLVRETHGYRVKIADVTETAIVHEYALSQRRPDQFMWFDDRQLLFSLQGSVYALNVDGSDLRPLLSSQIDLAALLFNYRYFKRDFRSWGIANTLPNDAEHILTTSVNIDGHQTVHKINVFTGEDEVLYDGKKHKVDHWLIDNQGKLRLAVKQRSSRTSYYKFVDGRLRKADNAELSLNFDGSTFLKNETLYLAPAAMQDEIYVLDRSGADRFKLARYNLLTNELTNLLSDDVYDIGTTAGNVHLHKARDGKLLGIGYRRDIWVTHWFDQDFQVVQDKLEARYPGQMVLIERWNQARTRFLVSLWDMNSRGKMVVYDQTKNRTAVLDVPPPHLDAGLPSKTELIRYDSAGVSIEAYLTTPRHGPAPWPLIVAPHGGPFVRSVEGYRPFVEYFASRGYAVLRPNFRGSTGYGRAHLLAGLGEIHDAMIADITAGTHWAVEQGIADPERLHLFGSSYGGYAALMSVILNPGLYHSAVSIAAPLDIKKQLKHYQKHKSHFALEYWREGVLQGNTSTKFLRSISPFYLLDKIQVPVHIYHGDADRTVPVAHAEALKEQLKKRARDNIEVRTLRSEGHGIGLLSNKVYVAERTLRLFEHDAAQQASAAAQAGAAQ